MYIPRQRTCLRCGAVPKRSGTEPDVECCGIIYHYSTSDPDGGFDYSAEKTNIVYRFLALPLSIFVLAAATAVVAFHIKDSPSWIDFLHSSLLTVVPFIALMAGAHDYFREKVAKSLCPPTFNNNFAKMLLFSSVGALLLVLLLIGNVFPDRLVRRNAGL